MLRMAAALAGVLVLGACAEGGVAGNLRAAGVGGSPDEFMVLPTKPLQMPSDFAALPPPTPGQSNLVDYHPHEEAVASLTGKEQPAGSARAGAVVAMAGPVDPNIRARLAAEDVVFRDENRGQFLPRLFASDPEDVIYRGVTLDAPAEFERQRAAGVGVPAAPPLVLEEDN
ncbi:MAG: DUF3035 domain-containing protein [Rhodovulum sulfidophilum]|uniref:DUF3035 domain-containing protein n=1 Tax=Rhodovulum sulfidophilum TaxID=35806 RepID=A0A2W5QC18_RHOSU|nr:MAG: DUF3035 domain-containing protein [Rhodovulum sulfidophilum]